MNLNTISVPGQQTGNDVLFGQMVSLIGFTTISYMISLSFVWVHFNFSSFFLLVFYECELAIVKIVQEILIIGGINFTHKNLP